MKVHLRREPHHTDTDVVAMIPLPATKTAPRKILHSHRHLRVVLFVALLVILFLFTISYGVRTSFNAVAGGRGNGSSRSKVKPFPNKYDRYDQRTARPTPMPADKAFDYEEGEYEPEEPDRLPRLQVHRHTYTPAELLAKYAATDYIYTFANGSETNHEYRKSMVVSCVKELLKMEKRVYTGTGALPAQLRVAERGNRPLCLPLHLERAAKTGATAGDLLRAITTYARPNFADRETDELRHSIRSVEQHVRWHRGRVVIVSPGHYPTWVDAAKNFLAGRCGDKKVQALRESGTHLRLTTVHQDALLPYGMRLTVNSHTIEQHLWRVRNITPVHVYMNDDYFVNRDVEITDLFNEYGGTIVRTESGIIRNGVRAPASDGSWNDGVRNTELFNLIEVDLRHEDYLPSDLEVYLVSTEKESGAVSNRTQFSPAASGTMVDLAFSHTMEKWPSRLSGRRPRRYAAHVPFVYCTNMFRFFSTRYAREWSSLSLAHRGRNARDLLLPFLYNAFIMARPWTASTQFLPYLVELHLSRRQRKEPPPAPQIRIDLDNVDGCGPASLRAGRTAADMHFARFSDNEAANDAMLASVLEANPLYFNINTAFQSMSAARQLRHFLHELFNRPVYLESADEELLGDVPVRDDASMTRVFDALMALPVVGLVSYDEGACPLVRSLALAFVDRHQGPVRVVVQRHSDEGEEEVSLRELRKTLRHRVVSAMSGVRCAFASHVTVQAAPKSATVADMVGDALESTVANSTGKVAVELPSTCGESGAGLRVRGFVVDARTPGAPVMSRATLREALAVPGQTLALEDFRVVTVGPGPRDVVLVLAREDAAAKAVHWVTGGAENDLLVTYPLPVPAYEDMSAPLKWSQP